MSERSQSYIGVTGPVTLQEVGHLVSTFEKNTITLESNHQPMIGILVSEKTLNGMDVGNRRYPLFSQVPTLLEAASNKAFNTLHYNTSHKESLSDQVDALFSEQIYDDNLSRGIQLNVVWPPIEELTKIKRSLPDLQVILQLSKNSLKKGPQEVAERLTAYSDLVDYALLDPSGGAGRSFQPEEILPYYEAIHEMRPNVSLGIAGGFTGDNVGHRIAEVRAILGHSNFSIDAEGGLRDKVTDEYGDDLYNSRKVEWYIEEAAKALLHI